MARILERHLREATTATAARVRRYREHSRRSGRARAARSNTLTRMERRKKRVFALSMMMLISVIVAYVTLKRSPDRALPPRASSLESSELAAPQATVPERSQARPAGSVAAAPSAAGSSALVEPIGGVVRRTIALAFMALDVEDFATARAAARDCLGRDPVAAECHHALLWSFTRKGEYGAELRQAIDDCLAVSPDEAYCLEAEVLASLRAGDLARARAALTRRDAAPDMQPDYIGEALVALASNDVAAACVAFEESCKIGQPYACRMVHERCAITGAEF